MAAYDADPYIYKVGELASLAGVNEQTVRRYSACGILKGLRDAQNGYRLYSAADMGMLLTARRYRSCSFSLDETAELLSSSVAHNIELFRRQKGLQERELALCKARLECMEEHIRELEASEGSLTECRMATRPGMYVCWYQDYLTILADEGRKRFVSKLIDLQPMTRPCSRFSEGHIRRRENHIISGIGIEERFFDLLELDGGECERYLEHIPAQQCLYSMTVTAGGIDAIKRERNNPACMGLHHVFDYVSAHHLRIAGEITLVSFYSYADQDDTLHRSHLWIPVEAAGTP